MSNSIYVSYSAAARFKSCPQKYYLSKKFQDRRISSALPFGKAVEKGVDALLDGKDLAFAQDAFMENWNTEHVRDNEYRQIFDNLDLQFYASDFDKNMFSIEDEQQLDSWAEELLDEKQRSWMEVFEDVNSLIKEDKEVADAQLAFYNRVIWLCCRIRGCVMLDAFAREILPNLDLTKREHFCSQREISMENNEGDKIVGYIDYVVYHKQHGWIILDLKTAGAPYNFHKLDTSEQLRTYVAAIGEEIGSRKAGYAVLLKKVKMDKTCNKCGADKQGMAKKCKSEGCDGEYTKSTPRGETQLIIKDFADEELDDILDDYMNVAVAMKNEVNFKNTENCFAFGRKCEFYEHCWKRKKLEDINHLEEKQKK